MGRSWYQYGCDVISEHYQRLHAGEPERSVDDILDEIRLKQYPFGERRYWPYKAWLRAIRDWRRLLRHTGRLYEPELDPNQTKLFDS